MLETVHGVHVVEQEGQIEQLDFFGVAVELGQGRRDELDVAEQDGFHFLGIAKQLRAGEYLDFDFAREQFFGYFLELDGALALGRGFGHDVAELDGNGFLRKRGAGKRKRGAATQGDENAGYDFFHWVVSVVLWSLELADYPYTVLSRNSRVKDY